MADNGANDKEVITVLMEFNEEEIRALEYAFQVVMANISPWVKSDDPHIKRAVQLGIDAMNVLQGILEADNDARYKAPKAH